jgi:hypothetical protein
MFRSTDGKTPNSKYQVPSPKFQITIIKHSSVCCFDFPVFKNQSYHECGLQGTYGISGYENGVVYGYAVDKIKDQGCRQYEPGGQSQAGDIMALNDFNDLRQIEGLYQSKAYPANYFHLSFLIF